MLSREDNRRLAELERRVRQDDPEFYARMTAAGPRHRRVPLPLVILAAVVWVATLVCAVAGWWLAATITATCATLTVVVLVYRMLPLRE